MMIIISTIIGLLPVFVFSVIDNWLWDKYIYKAIKYEKYGIRTHVGAGFHYWLKYRNK